MVVGGVHGEYYSADAPVVVVKVGPLDPHLMSSALKKYRLKIRQLRENVCESVVMTPLYRTREDQRYPSLKRVRRGVAMREVGSP